MCVPWELNPQPFALLTQCSTTETQEHVETFEKKQQRQLLVGLLFQHDLTAIRIYFFEVANSYEFIRMTYT